MTRHATPEDLAAFMAATDGGARPPALTRDSAPAPPPADRLELELLRARLRHGWSVTCDRCGNTLTLSSTSIVELGQYLARTALALGWQLTEATSDGCGYHWTSPHQSDRCPACVAICSAVPASSR